MRIIVTGGAIIRDNEGRILLQKRSDYGKETLKLEFKFIEDINIEDISTVQRPVFEDVKREVITILRT
ncbi:hypothetical protein QPK24_10740 [Paenibacillus polygoni]|uniref:Asparaginase n=1 Tax=Paenibacillus polygoni TaxID=3050112 RepID=A0ABY8X9F2_9BACL|nr:hypothetical protein [Paenibacillus polygoni]WIV21106.1 hypothetical protein QPK24_10740 [Paenibacillus polygoni]